MTQRTEGVERMSSDWTELLVRSGIDQLRREAEHERLAGLVHYQWHGPAVQCAGSLEGWLREGVADVVGALLRRPATREGSLPSQSGTS